MPIAVNGLSPGRREGQLLYTLNTPDISGIFLLREGDYFEQRIFHSADHRVAQVCALPGQDQIAFVLRQRDGGASIAVMTAEGKEFTEITQGDSIDEFPHWVPGRPGFWSSSPPESGAMPGGSLQRVAPTLSSKST